MLNMSTLLYFTARLPLLLVFLSGLGFSLQVLLVKVLEEQTDFSASFVFVFFRGMIQLVIAAVVVYLDKENRNIALFGDTHFVRTMMFVRTLVGFGGIAFSFLAVELLPIGDSQVIVMLSPIWASILSFLILGEPWHIQEFCATVLSLIGALFIARPSFIFGSSTAISALGVLFALCSSLSAGCAFVCVRILG